MPIKPGEFDLYVGNVPSAVGRPMGESGIQAKGKFVIGRSDSSIELFSLGLEDTLLFKGEKNEIHSNISKCAFC